MTNQSTPKQTFGNFGHHTEPAYDFCIEVEVLQGLLYDTQTQGEPTIQVLIDRITRAMEFIVGGDEQAIKAKDILRKIEFEAHALARSPVLMSSSWFAWVQGPSGPLPALWHDGDKTLQGKPKPHLWKYNLAMGEDTDFGRLQFRFPYDRCVGNLPTKPKQYATVRLLNYTGYGMSDPAHYAARLLCYTKATRLEQGEDTYNKILAMTQDDVDKELDYMSKTIRSSWEFIDYTFEIKNVTRAFTHQLVRTRTGSYAQQAQRVVDMANFGNSVPDTVQMNKDANGLWKETMNILSITYKQLQDMGIPNQDCRGLLPTNVHTNIIAKFNLRTLADLVAKRKNLRAQGEYGFVAAEMERCVLAVHPWAKVFLSPDRLATPALDQILKAMVGTGSPVDQPLANAALKEIDALKGTWG